MKVELNEKELRTAIEDWVRKQIPELLAKENSLKLLTVSQYPVGATATIEFVLSEVKENASLT